MQAGLFILALIIFAMPRSAYAYIDAGTGSMILQVLVAGAAGLVVLIKMYWQRLMAMISRRKTAVSTDTMLNESGMPERRAANEQ